MQLLANQYLHSIFEKMENNEGGRPTSRMLTFQTQVHNLRLENDIGKSFFNLTKTKQVANDYINQNQFHFVSTDRYEAPTSTVSSRQNPSDPVEINQRVDDTIGSGMFSQDDDEATSEEQLDKLFKQQIKQIFISLKEDEQEDNDVSKDVINTIPPIEFIDASLDHSSVSLGNYSHS